MATLTQYSSSVFSANARGKSFMDRATTKATWRGPPIVAFFLGEAPLSPSLPILDAVVAFAALFDAPLVVLDQSADATARDVLRGAHDHYGKFYDYLGQGVALGDGVARTPVVLAGPWMGVGSTTGNRNSGLAEAWSLAASYCRTTQFHPYGRGMEAASTFDVATGRISPPVYSVGTDVAGDLGKIADRWRGRVATTASAHQAVYDAQAAGRPGLARYVNPILVPYVKLS